jgi:hypothetical protein
MSAGSFWRSALHGLVCSAAGALAFTVLAPLLGVGAAARLLLAALALASLALVLRDGRARVGRLVTLAGWLVLTAALFVLDPTLWAWLLAYVGGLWLARGLYRYDSLRAAGLDALVTLFALAAGVAAARHSGSVFLALWSFHLVQALCALIGVDDARAAAASEAPDERFEQAWRTAESALRRLSLP